MNLVRKRALAMRTLIIAVTFISCPILNNVLACSCGPFENDFYKNIHVNSEVGCLRLDSIYSIGDTGGMGSQHIIPIGIFTIVDDLSIKSKSKGDTIHVVGQDGINCSHKLGDVGDTIIGSLSYSVAAKRRFMSIKWYAGITCGTHMLTIKNGMVGTRSVKQAKDAIRGILLSDGHQEPRNKLLHIFPNPVIDYLTINYNGVGIMKVTISDISGRLQQEFHVEPGDNRADLTAIRPGSYVVQFEDARVFEIIKR